MQTGGFAGSVTFVGFDSSIKLVEALERGEINGLVLQNPMRMGNLGVKTLIRHVKGEEQPDRIDTGVVLATPKNRHDEEIKMLLEPDFSQWLK